MNAKTAKKKVLEFKKKFFSHDVSRVLAEIEDEVAMGYEKTFVRIERLNGEEQAFLKKLGYKVKVRPGTVNSFTDLEISWK